MHNKIIQCDEDWLLLAVDVFAAGCLTFLIAELLTTKSTRTTTTLLCIVHSVTVFRYKDFILDSEIMPLYCCRWTNLSIWLTPHRGHNSSIKSNKSRGRQIVINAIVRIRAPIALDREIFLLWSIDKYDIRIFIRCVLFHHQWIQPIHTGRPFRIIQQIIVQLCLILYPESTCPSVVWGVKRLRYPSHRGTNLLYLM